MKFLNYDNKNRLYNIMIFKGVIIIIIILGCQNGEFSEGRDHPTNKNIPDENNVNAIISDRKKGVSGIDTDKARRLRDTKLIDSIGTLRREENYIIGNVMDIEVRQNIHVLDGKYGQEKVYKRNGRYTYRYGRKGSGPGSITDPSVLSIKDNETRIVSRRKYLQVFNMKNDEPFDRFNIGLVSEDGCLLNDAIYLRGTDNNAKSTIQKYGLDGKLVERFGETYKSESFLVRDQLSDGTISCIQNSETIVSTFEYIPIIRGYGRLGDMRWISMINNLSYIDISETMSNQGTPAIQYDGSELYDKIIS